jgi:hypothetical protein
MKPATLVMTSAHPAPPRRPFDAVAESSTDTSGDPVAGAEVGSADAAGPFCAVFAVR